MQSLWCANYVRVLYISLWIFAKYVFRSVFFFFLFSFPLLALFSHIVAILMVIVVLVWAYADWQNLSFEIAIAVLMSGNACMWLERERN